MPDRPCILVIEDEALVRLLAVDALEELGFAVEEAGSAKEALAKLSAATEPFAAVLADIGLPDQKGDVLAADIRATHADLPIIVASGYGEDSLPNLARDKLVGFLGKPYDVRHLEALLRKLGVIVAAPS